MRFLILLFAFLLFTNFFLNAQSGEWRFLLGAKVSSEWNRPQQYSIPGEDYYWQINETQPIILPVFSAIYSHKLTGKFDWSLGINLDKHGFKEIGTFYDLVPVEKRIYENNYTKTYVGALVGLRYRISELKNWKISTEVLLNPELCANDYNDGTKKTALSAMFMINFEKLIFKHTSIVISPVFQTAIMNYKLESTPSFATIPYTKSFPFSLGINMGVKF